MSFTYSTAPNLHMGSALRIENASKDFDGRTALHRASFECVWGEVHALLGENGAGKSTLMNIVCGLYAPDEGLIAVNGEAVSIAEPTDAAKLAIGMVHQHYKLVHRFTVAENVVLSCGSVLGIHRTAAAAAAISAKAAEVGFTIDPNSVVGELSIAEQQRVEILKVLLLGAKILILDEPTAVLTDQESELALSFMRQLAQNGHSVVLITHKLREVMGHSDRVTVMRHGKTVLTGANTDGLTQEELARIMVGGETSQPARHKRTLGEVRLEAENLAAGRIGGGHGVDGLSLKVAGGEILGVAGVSGNGQQELADVLMGLRTPERGVIRIDGEDLAGRGVSDFRSHGMRAVPADRFGQGLLADLSVSENYGLTGVAAGRYGSWGLVRRAQIRSDVTAAIKKFQIKGAEPTTPVRLLSGGNAQKLLLSRELGDKASVLIVHSPTRGLDVAAYRFVHSAIQDAADQGAACLLISEDLEEVLTVSTTIAVMSRGRIVGRFSADKVSREEIGKLMLGHA